MLFLILLPLITTGCRTTKTEKGIVLPPKPQRQELKSPENLSNLADTINYYEHLVQEWELWADTIEAILTDVEK